jgi:sulfate permease, SulP family
MISGATGAMALLMVPLVREHGVEYLFAATVVTGVLQVVLGWLGVGSLMRFIPRTVMTGFVNALAVLIFLAQLPYIVGEAWTVWALVVGGLAIMYALPRVTKVVPAPLVAIVALTGLVLVLDVRVPTVGGMGELPDTLPVLGLPAVPFTLETLQSVAPTRSRSPSSACSNRC